MSFDGGALTLGDVADRGPRRPLPHFVVSWGDFRGCALSHELQVLGRYRFWDECALFTLFLKVKQVLILVMLPRELLLLAKLIKLIKHDIFVFRRLYIIDSLRLVFVPQGILQEKRLSERVH